MGNDSGLDAATVRGLVSNLGLSTVAEVLEIDEDSVVGVMEGRFVLDDGLRELVREVCESLGVVFGCGSDEVIAEATDELEACDVGEPPPEGWGDGGEFGVDLDGDGVADVRMAPVPARPGITWEEDQRRQRDSLRKSLAYAQMTRFRLNMSEMEYVTALGLVTQIELALITHFGESVPNPRENWDESRRWRETSRRLARLRWVQEQQDKEYGGVKGLFNRVMGRRKLSGKELYEKMVADADWMIAAMRDGHEDTDVVRQVMGFVGMDDRGRLPG